MAASDTPAKPTEAAYSDGQSARSASVAVTLVERGLQIDGPTRDGADGDAPVIWPYAALATAEPLSAKTTDALITYEHQPGATVYVTDAAFIDALKARAPHLSSGSQRWHQARPWLWATAAVVLIAAFVHFGGLSPARTIAGLLPDSTRASIGRNVVTSMTAGKPVCRNPAGVAALDRLTEKLRRAAGVEDAFDVRVAKWKLTNAFAAPGETIILTSQLISEAQDPSEVAGVLAHEMGHGIARHPETSIVRALGLGAALELLTGGSGGMIAGLGMIMTQLSYSRDAEREADATALWILKKANISSQGLSDFFRRMEAKRVPLDRETSDTDTKATASKPGDIVADEDGAPTSGLSLGRFLQSHPTTDERLARIDEQASDGGEPAMSDADWAALRGICDGAAVAPKG